MYYGSFPRRDSSAFTRFRPSSSAIFSYFSTLFPLSFPSDNLFLKHTTYKYIFSCSFSSSLFLFSRYFSFYSLTVNSYQFLFLLLLLTFSLSVRVYPNFISLSLSLQPFSCTPFRLVCVCGCFAHFLLLHLVFENILSYFSVLLLFFLPYFAPFPLAIISGPWEKGKTK